jgi:hypothetical protein
MTLRVQLSLRPIPTGAMNSYLRSKSLVRKVIDANYFQSPDLTRYLGASKANIAVLPDIAGMEAYKGDPVRNLERSYEILHRFPRQVLILRGTRVIVKTAADAKNHTRWMEDKEQTAGFALFYQQIKLAVGGDEPQIRAVQRIATDAVEHFNRVRCDVTDIPTAYDGMASIYTDADKRQLRTGLDHTNGPLRNKIVRQMLELAAFSLSKHPDVRDFPRRLDAAVRRLPARYAIANYLLFLRKLLNGGHRSVGSAHLASDVADMMYIAYATYFDGLLSKEKMVNDVYLDLLTVLSWIGQPPEL